MNSVRNGLPPRSNLPPVGPGSSASGLTKRQSPYLVVLVASHYLLGSPLLVGAVYVSHANLPRESLLFLSIRQLSHIAQMRIDFLQSLTS